MLQKVLTKILNTIKAKGANTAQTLAKVTSGYGGATHSFDRCIKANTAGVTTGYTPKKAVLNGLMYCKVTRLPRYIRVTFHTNIVRRH